METENKRPLSASRLTTVTNEIKRERCMVVGYIGLYLRGFGLTFDVRQGLGFSG